MRTQRRVEVIEALLAAMVSRDRAALVAVLGAERPTVEEVDAATDLRRLDLRLTNHLGRTRHLGD